MDRKCFLCLDRGNVIETNAITTVATEAQVAVLKNRIILSLHSKDIKSKKLNARRDIKLMIM